VQPGCVLFSLYRSSENLSGMVGFERWRPEDHQRHLQGAHVQRLMFAMADSLAEPPQIASYEIVDEN
jgi:quinol monooxygenase YgiN